MTILEAVVWIIGILTAGGTLGSIAKSFSNARATVRDVIEELDQKRHEEQMEKERQYVREDDSEDH